MSKRAIFAENERDRALETAELSETQQQQTQASLEEERKKNQQLRDRLIQLGLDPETLP